MHIMGSTWRRLKIYYINNVRLSRVLSLIGAVCLLYLLSKFIFPSSHDLTQYSEGEEEIKDIIDSIQDTRPNHCRNKGFDFTRNDLMETISILTEFHDKQFYDLQLTLTSIVEHTPYDLYNEIVIIDDGTKDSKIRQQVVRFLQNPKFNKAKLYRSDTRDGQSATRYKASQLAKGSILVYVSSTTLVNHGWIQPLLTSVVQEPRTFIIPHSDNILSGHRFARTDDSFVPIFTWSLSTVYTETDLYQQSKDGLLNAPAMRGDVLAVKKSFLNEIGNFDEHMRPPELTDGVSETGAGHHLELSLRAWLCANGIKVATCSRVASHNTLRPHHVVDPVNYHRIAELWLDEKKGLAYRQGKVASHLSGDESQLLTIRRGHLKQLMGKSQSGGVCRDFRWYLENVAKNVRAPTTRAVNYGKLKSKNGNYCLRASGNGLATTPWTIDMTLCRPHIYDLQMIFELNSAGQLQAVQGSGLSSRGMLESACLVPDWRSDELGRSKGDVQGREQKGLELGGVVRLEHCVEGEERQKWKMVGDSIRYDKADGSERCLSHLTDRDSITSDLIHVVRLTECAGTSNNNEEQLSRQSWEFLHY